MNFKEITDSISDSEDVPAEKVRKIGKALLARLGEAIDNGEKLQLPGLTFFPRTNPAKDADGDKPARPERKVAILRCRNSDSKNVVEE